MIQRIQSLFLLLVVLLSAALFLLPVYSLETVKPADGVSSVAIQYVHITTNMVDVVLNSVAGIFALITIFIFKNRNLQIRLCNLNMLIICIFTGTIFYFADHSKTNPGSVVHYMTGCYFPLVQLVLSFLAMRAIRKDEELVRSADRLR